MRKLKLIYLLFLTKNWSINFRTVRILLGYTTCFSTLSALNLQRMFSQGRGSKKDGAPTTDFAFLRKVEARARRHAEILDNSAHASGVK